MSLKSTLNNACTGLEPSINRHALRVAAPRPLWYHQFRLTSSGPPAAPFPDPDFAFTSSFDKATESNSFAPFSLKDDHKQSILDGITKWRDFPWQRARSMHRIDMPKQAGILFNPRNLANSNDTLLCIPSLINDWTIFDLHPQQSFYTYLAKQLFLTPLIFDWGPRLDNATLEDHVTQKLEPVIRQIVDWTGRPPILLGYCMGGLFALKVAEMGIPCRGLFLIATPWDFHQGYDFIALGQFGLLAEPVLEQKGYLPADWLALLFSLLNPGALATKFSRVWHSDEWSDTLFSATEDWLNSGHGLGETIARQTIWDMFIDNCLACPASDSDATRLIDTRRVRQPTLLGIPGSDRIVPKESALSLAKFLPNVQLLHLDEGHIGLMSSRHAPQRSWPLIRNSLEDLLKKTADA